MSRTAPKSKQLAPKVSTKKGDPKKFTSPHKNALINAAGAGQRAVAAAKKADATITRYQTAAKAGKFNPVVPVTVTRVNGDGTVMLGAVPAVAKKLTPKQAAAVKKQAGAAAKVAFFAKQTKAASDIAKKKGADALAFVKKTTPLLKAALDPKGKKGKTVVGLLDEELLGALTALDTELVGVDANGLYPGDEGYDPTTDPDAQSGTPPAQAAGAGAVLAPDGTVLYDPANDPGIIPMPVRGQPLSKDNAQFQWEHVPEGSILCPVPAGEQEVGSWSLMYDKPWINEQQGVGFIWHANPREPLQWWALGIGTVVDKAKAALIAAFAPFGAAYAKQVSESQSPPGHGEATGISDAVAIHKASIAAGCGPVVGNPGGKLAGLQLAAADSAYFWLGDNAPAWAAQDVDSKIKEANAKIVAANTAAAKALAAQMATDAAMAAAEAAKVEAANALAEKTALSEAAVAKTKQETERAQMEIDQQRADQMNAADQARLEAELLRGEAAAAQDQARLNAEIERANLAAWQKQAEIDAAAQHALIEQANVWNEWAQAHPEEAVRQMQAEDDSPVEEPVEELPAEDDLVDDESPDAGFFQDEEV